MLHITQALTAYIITITAALGLIMGSFLNCMAWRMTHSESVLKGRSHCASCNHVLGALDLVPVVSWLLLKGRCRYCGRKISPRYPAAELVTAVVFVSLVLRYDVSFTTLKFLLLACVLIALSLVDFEQYILPDSLVIAGILIFIIMSPFNNTSFLKTIFSGIAGSLAVTVPLLILVLLADKITGKETMGGGDIKLLFMVGLYFDWRLNLMLLIFACFLGLLLALLMGKAKPGTPFPFGPAIGAAAFLVMLIGEPLLNWYIGLFYYGLYF
jgi:leader peptidase (prepilin peptidase)/N-methyltransferase